MKSRRCATMLDLIENRTAPRSDCVCVYTVRKTRTTYAARTAISQYRRMKATPDMIEQGNNNASNLLSFKYALCDGVRPSQEATFSALCKMKIITRDSYNRRIGRVETELRTSWRTIFSERGAALIITFIREI